MCVRVKSSIMVFAALAVMRTVGEERYDVERRTSGEMKDMRSWKGMSTYV
jgi:hypothetical protein|tara:strand:- start:29637 stop:29786 length:150 start_codon:yes stop_codon:yes gene_type:complete